MRLPLALLVLTGAVPASADALLDTALAHGGAWSPNDWAYVSTTRVNAGGSNVVGDAWDRATTGKREAMPTRNVRIVTFDPSKPAGQRQVVLKDDSVRGDGKRGGVVIDTDEKDRLPSYAEMRQIVKRDAVKVGETVATATYRFKTPLSDIRNIGSADLDIEAGTPVMLSGTAVVQKTGPHAPYVRTVTVWLPTGDKGRGNAAGKIKLMSMGFRFAPDPAKGTQLLRAFGFDSSFQALGLMTVDASFLNKVDGYRFVGKR